MLQSFENLKKQLEKKQEKHDNYLKYACASYKLPVPDKKVLSLIKGVRRVPSSSTAALGNVDSYGLNLEAQEWLKESYSQAETAEDAFWAKKAPNKKSRMWNDASISDALFAADMEIVSKDSRQNSTKNKNPGL